MRTAKHPQWDLNPTVKSMTNIDKQTITATAGELLKLISGSGDMELKLIGNLSSSGSDCLEVLDYSGELLNLDDAIRYLDNSEIIELKEWKYLTQDYIFLVYGLPAD
ncbi:MAG: hypothetical protein HPY61_02555 [Methanotrichaceae archaeon]|nr:hypothetical protein [Methanotrichaceae archaeon]